LLVAQQNYVNFEPPSTRIGSPCLSYA
jgi:hypothetical protein